MLNDVSLLNFQDYAVNPSRMAIALWDAQRNLSRVKAIQWGNQHEEDARLQYEGETGFKVEKCGLFVSREDPEFGASPDGVIIGDRLLEIKCPFSLKDENLATLKEVKSTQFFTVESAGLKLKRAHSYFYQVQLAMYVTGYRKTDFVI